MGDTRSRAGRSGAQALPLTRRQQKRARRSPARRQNQQRQPQQPRQAQQAQQQQPPKPLQTTPATTANATTASERPSGGKAPKTVPPAATSIAAVAPMTAPTAAIAAPATDAAAAPAVQTAESKRSARAARAERNARVKAQVPASETAPETAPALPATAEATPARRILRRVKTGAPAQRAASAARTIKAAASAASGRKYPTLARMMAVAPRPDTEEIPVAEEAHDAVRTPRSRQSARRDAARLVEMSEAPDLVPEAEDGEHDPALLETRPIAAAPSAPSIARTPAPVRRPVQTRRLPSVHHPAQVQVETDALRANDSTSPATSGFRPLPAPDPDLIVPVAAGHAGFAAAAALVGAGFLLSGVGNVLWPLSLAAIVGAGSWLGYGVSGHSRRAAAVLLLLAQLGVVAWLLTLVGPRAAVLALVPSLALLALRWLGRAAAYATALAALALYALAALLQQGGALPVPVTLSAAVESLLDGGFVAVGLLCLLLLASHMHSAQIRAEQATRARRHEVRTLRAQLAEMREQVEDDAARLDEALAHALTAHGPVALVKADGLLSPLAETTNAAVERLALLQRDREERLRLEGAVRTVTRAVERAWLGLPWFWPEWSGTALDELVALLRTPRPQETQAEWSGELPTLAAIPTVEREVTPRPWERPTPPTPISTPMSTVRAAWQRALNGTVPGASNGHAPGTEAEWLTTSARTPSALLPWREWDTWGEWAAERGD